MAAEHPWYCIQCGAQLETGHGFCWSCGAPRWPQDGQPDAPREPEGQRAPPVPGTPVFGARPAPAPRAAVSLGPLPWFYAAGAILFLVYATQFLAYLLSPGGRAQLVAGWPQQGTPASTQALLTAYGIFVVGGSLVAAVLHGAAFYGLRRLRRWGWISAVVVAALWSLLVVGIPVLVRLVNRNVRQAFGVD